MTFEGAEGTPDGDHKVLELPSACVTTEQTDAREEGEKRRPQLLVRGPGVPHVADLIESNRDVRDTSREGLAQLLETTLHQPGLQQPFQIRTFDDVDTLDGYSGSHPTNLSVRLS